jgi:hypothetical protein
MRQGPPTAFRIPRSVLLVTALVALGAGCKWDGLSVERGNLVSPNGAITQAGDEARTGWYPDQPGLDPAIVGGASFGRLFKTQLPLTVGEQVLAQPLVYNGKVFIATEANNLYLLDGVTGAITNSRALGAAYNASAGVGCGDINPTVGITGTPVIDTSSGTAYFFSKSDTGVWTFHAVDATNLAERAGFPVTIAGTAQNEPLHTFDSIHQHQRPGLLLMNGVVYGGFGAHCDIGTYRGWIVGVSTTGQIKALFSTVKGSGANGRGNGIWMSGGGLMSDGAGQILFSTGNGYNNNQYPNPIPTNTDPGPIAEGVARLAVQADGTLKTTDAFIPYNYAALDGGDADLGSGGVIALPSQFGTTAIPHLAMVAGKGGTFYLLNRDHLGGYKQGAAGGDAVLSAVPLGGATWQRPAAWPGDGGYMYAMVNGGGAGPTFCLEALKYGTDVNGNPTASYIAKSTENFGSYSGSPIVTSNGTNSGTALVWATSQGSDIRAYDAVPVNGSLTLRFHDAYGNQAKFTTIGVGSGRVYVGSGDGYVIGYGSTALPPVSGGPVDFGTVFIGQNKTLNVTLTANQNMTVTGFSTSAGVYTTGASTPGVPNAMTASQTMTVPVTFAPTASGNVSATLTVATSAGNALVTLTGVGQVNGPNLVVSPTNVPFGGVATGTTKSLTVSLQNTGNQTLTFGASTAPAAPFSATGLPASGATLAAGASTTVTATFSPTTDGMWSGSLGINSDGGNATVALTGTSGAPPLMQIIPMTNDYGTVAVGTSATLTFVVKNVGGTDLTITKSKPPALGPFVATTSLPEGAIITSGAQVTESVTFTPTAAGAFNDIWVITGNDSTGVQNVAFTGTGVAALSRTGWTATALQSSGDVPANALDNNVATRWSSGAAMANGMWFQVDMGATNTVSVVSMDSAGSNGDYSHAFQVVVSNDGVNFSAPVATGTGTGQVVTASFAPVVTRFVRVVNTQAVTPNWWSIAEFNVYGTPGGTPPNPPAAPSGLTAGNATSSSIDLAWTASATSGVTYSVFRGTASGFTPNAGSQVASGLTGLSYTDTNLAGSTAYYYVVEAVNANGTSAPSNQATATTQASQALTALSRTGWVATATPASATDTPAKAIDGQAASRFSSGAAQVNGQWFQVDMLTAQSFSRVVMDSTASANDYAHTYQIFVSNDGTNFGTAIASGTGATVTTANFPNQSARYIRVVQTSNTPANWWSIHEFNVYGGGATPPAAPTALAATAASASQINLTWTASATSGVTYTVFRSTTSGFTASAANQIASGVAGTTYSSTGLAASTAYYFLVQANNAGGASASSNQATATTQATPPPNPPTGLGATAASPSAINLNWTASTTSGVTYTIFRSTTSGFTASAANQIATGLTTLTYADSGLTASTTYYYLAQANNAGGASASSNQATATTQAAPPPNPPTALAATAASASQINLTWTASTTSGVTYTIFRSTTSGFTASAANQIATGVAGTTYSSTGLTASTTYYFLAQANGSTGTSTSSNQATATTQAAPPPNPPTALAATAASSSQINLTWTASTTSGVTYTIFRSTTSGFTASAANQIATGVAGTTYSSTGLAASTTYYFLAQANGTGGASASSNQATATTQAGGGVGGPQQLARTGWVASASVTGGTDVAANALDASATTRWSTGVAEAVGQWFQLDLGAAQTFDQIVVTSNADYARNYQVFVSTDGASWGTAIASGAGTTGSTSISFAPQTKRWVRIQSNAAAANWWSIYDINLWNNFGNPPPTAYARTAWIATASNTGGADTPSKAIDAVAGTRWSSGVGQANGQWFQVDMGVAQPFVEIIMDSTGNAGDYARGYQVFVSNDGASWGTAVASGTPTSGPVITVSLAAQQNARFVRVVQTSTTPGSWWSITDFSVLHY